MTSTFSISTRLRYAAYSLCAIIYPCNGEVYLNFRPMEIAG